MDGNKRTAYVARMIFLRLHGFRFRAPGPEYVVLFERLGKGKIEQKDLGTWLKAHAVSQKIFFGKGLAVISFTRISNTRVAFPYDLIGVTWHARPICRVAGARACADH